MLRSAVMAAAVLFVIAAIVLTALQPQSWPVLLVSLIVGLGCIAERRYGLSTGGPPEGGWQPTGERFVDPSSGKLVAVWYDPASGARRYVEVDPPSDA